jgi:hypothetical protein
LICDNYSNHDSNFFKPVNILGNNLSRVSQVEVRPVHYHRITYTRSQIQRYWMNARAILKRRYLNGGGDIINIIYIWIETTTRWNNIIVRAVPGRIYTYTHTHTHTHTHTSNTSARCMYNINISYIYRRSASLIFRISYASLRFDVYYLL